MIRFIHLSFWKDRPATKDSVHKVYWNKQVFLNYKVTNLCVSHPKGEIQRLPVYTKIVLFLFLFNYILVLGWLLRHYTKSALSLGKAKH